MDKYSFLNAANTAFFADLYDQYLQSPDSVEPSWRAFFQGFDFGVENTNGSEETIYVEKTSEETVTVPENVQKEFQVVRLIDAYRTRGHLFTKTNPVRDRRKYTPSLALENFGLSQADLNTILERTSDPVEVFVRNIVIYIICPRPSACVCG